jgi:pimeloyl-ACP methyl ester carboxylesterase
MGEATVLLLHGQPGSARDWDRVREAIGVRARTLAIDRPGWNGSSAPSDLAGNARAALTALDRAGVERATVVGHSLGAAVAAWLAAEHPARVEALVLAAPSANRESLNRLDLVLATPVLGPLLATAGLAGTGAALWTRSLRGRLAAGLGLGDGYLQDAGRALLRPATWRVFSAEQRMLIRQLPALEQRLPSISSPTTIVSGTADRIVTPSSARRLTAQIHGAELVQVPQATHLLPQQCPAELAEVILRAVDLAALGG